MKNLSRVGFFKELPYGDSDADSIFEAKGKLKTDNIDEICNYLLRGVLLIMSPGMTKDFFSLDGKIIGSGKILTDGEWAWHSDLSYYVRYYAVNLPNPFLQHMRKNKNIPQDLDILKLSI